MRQPVPFGKYLLLDRISVGGMAEVFKAKSYGVEGFEKIIAIKRILPSMGEDREFIKMFIDEAKIAGQLAHANICQIFELGRIDGAHFIAMEYIWGKDLLQIQNRLRKGPGIMPVGMACYVLSKVLEGLDYAHRKRDPMGRPLEIVHRDCSPQNVLISYEGEVKLIDFGIAKAASRSSRTMAGVLKGKFGYMSPEQVRGLPLDRRSDIFALGTMLYECTTGERLFQGETDFSTLEKVRNVDILKPRQVNPKVPVEVEDIILRALAKDVEDRYQWCGEMLADLQRFLISQEAMFTAKTLASWIREVFANDLERERKQLESYRKIGRDGLIAGAPAAHAKVDLVEQLGAAGVAEDPTMLGGPSFDDVVADEGRGATAPMTERQRADYSEEAPTEIFGEIGDVKGLAAQAARDGVMAPSQAVSSMRPGGAPPSGRLPPLGGAHDKTLLAAPAPFLPHDSGRSAPYPSGNLSAHPSGPMPAELSPPSLPSTGVSRRSTLIRDIAIGVAIAVVVLLLIGLGRMLFVGDRAAARAPTTVGNLVVQVGGGDADVVIDETRRGITQAGRIEVGELAVGKHIVKIVHGGVVICESTVEVAATAVASLSCEIPALPALVEADAGVDAAIVDAAVADARRSESRRERSDARVALDEVDAGEAPPASDAGRPEGTRPDAGRTEVKPPPAIDAGTAAAAQSDGEVGYLAVSTKPFARLWIDGADTGKTTPILESRKLRLKPGKHKLKFVVGEQSETFTVIIEAGKLTSFSKDLQIGAAE